MLLCKEHHAARECGWANDPIPREKRTDGYCAVCGQWFRDAVECTSKRAEAAPTR